MKAITLTGTSRTEIGKKIAKATRKNGHVPCVAYGNGESLLFNVEEKDFKSLIYTPEANLVELNIDGKSYSAILKDTAFHPISDKLLHADFYLVTKENPVAMSVPVKLIGTAAGVLKGGKLMLSLRRIKVKGLVDLIPDFLTIDITDLKIGESFRIKDLSFKGLEINEPKSLTVVSVAATRGSVKDEA